MKSLEGIWKVITYTDLTFCCKVHPDNTQNSLFYVIGGSGTNYEFYFGNSEIEINRDQLKIIKEAYNILLNFGPVEFIEFDCDNNFKLLEI